MKREYEPCIKINISIDWVRFIAPDVDVDVDVDFVLKCSNLSG